VGKTSHFLALNVNISKTVGDTSKVTIMRPDFLLRLWRYINLLFTYLITNIKSHMRVRLTPILMTLDNLELI